MTWIIIAGVSFLGIALLKRWTRHTYYEGLKAGTLIGEGVSRGQNINELSKRYDRYKRETITYS